MNLLTAHPASHILSLSILLASKPPHYHPVTKTTQFSVITADELVNTYLV